MSMRLMPKSKVSQANAVAKKKDIDEGVKLAKRIDGLRETLADEEQSLDKFRVAQIEGIKAETAPLEEYLGGLKKEIEELERTRAQLLIPLDEEWDKVNKLKEELKQKEHEVGEVQKATKKDKDEAREELRTAKDAKKQAVFCEKEAENKLNDATIELRNAKELKEQAVTTIREADIYKHEALAIVTEEQRKLKLREEALVINEEKNEEDREEIAATKLQLEDQRATLGRVLKRKS